ncbi:cytochrome P450 704C1-like isoform X2 [Mucor ambiguus]|uniref:Cytochrome P450 704C1-like isoform X2 n=1 Tax=Mucor ambiguus TaxID=91626 RepID=A0A0C9LTH8_9FUNG|nr:cytochrome P450 704C1-like isoform X2 [Mucor ambiguus]
MTVSPSKTEILGITAATVTLVTALLALKYPDRGAFHEHREGLLDMEGAPVLGNLPSMIKNMDRFYDYLTEHYEKMNTLTFRTTFFMMPSLICTADPRNVEHILKNNFEGYIKGSEFDYTMHDLLGEGIFNSDVDIPSNCRVFVDEINLASREIFDKAATSGEIIDFHDIMLRFSMDSFAELGFGVKLNSLLERADFADSFDALQLHSFKKSIIPGIEAYETAKHYLFYWSKEKSIKQHLDTVNAFAKKLIKERHEEEQAAKLSSIKFEKGDLLSRFMKAASRNGQTLDDNELRDTILNFIIAGRDTTAQALSWTFYQLMLFPEIQEKVYTEAEQFITEEVEADPSKLYTVIQNMVYSHAVLFEVLRLYPSVPGNQKEAVKDDVWPDGTRVYKGEQISWQPYCQGHLTKVWGSDAKEFKPERWLSETVGSLVRVSPFQWSAFNAGPRVCLGQNLAILEALVAITLIIKRYKFHQATGHKVEILNLVTLSMKDGLKITVEKRKS